MTKHILMVQDHTWTERSQIRSLNVTHMHERTIRVDTEEDTVRPRRSPRDRSTVRKHATIDAKLQDSSQKEVRNRNPLILLL